MKKKRVTKVVCKCEYVSVSTTLNRTLYAMHTPKTCTNLFTPFKDLYVVFHLLGRLIETILSIVTKKKVGADRIMHLKNPLGLRLHQKGTENGKQWIIHRVLLLEWLLNFQRMSVYEFFVSPCEFLSVRHTSCMFRKC